MDTALLAIAAAFSATGLFYGLRAWSRVRALNALLRVQRMISKADHRRLTNLRENCFVTNEKGHRVRYWNASEEARAKAEQ